jgi:hypothetical protein
MQSGSGAMWEFQTRVPVDYSSKKRLYVWGAINYKDRIGERSFVFARYYDPAKRQFVRENNPDYDSSDSEK